MRSGRPSRRGGLWAHVENYWELILSSLSSLPIKSIKEAGSLWLDGRRRDEAGAQG